jgi:protein-tyrosine phosphatase
MRWLFPRRARPPADFVRIAPWLVLGSALSPAGYKELARAGITHVLDLRSEASDDPALMRRLGLGWRRVPVEDRAAPTTAQLDEIERWLHSGDPDPVLYVHCEGGLGRSPTIAIALLMRRGFARAEAHRFVLTARSVAAPTSQQLAWLTEIEDSLRDRP